MLLSFTITAALFTIVVALGFRLGRHAKPYPTDLLILHVAPFFVIVVGIGECMKAIDTALPGNSAALTTLYIAGPALIVLFVSGVFMSISKRKMRAWVFIHKLAMYFLGFSLLASCILVVMKI